MKTIQVLFLSLLLSVAVQAQDFYKLSAKSIDGKTVKMSEYKSKVLLVVNTASKCGLTPQYEGLEELYKNYSDKGFVVLGFPCNQFGKQEPGSAEEIAEFCQKNYGVSFPMFDKIDVNGDNTHPIFEFLKSKHEGSIKWNFTKFLIDRQGNVIKRYAPTTKPSKIAEDIAELL